MSDRNTIATALHDAILRVDYEGAKEILQRLDREERRIIVCGLNSESKNSLEVAMMGTAYPCPYQDLAELNRRHDAMMEAFRRGDFDPVFPEDKKTAMVKLLLLAGAEVSTDCVIHETMHGSYTTRSSLLQRATPNVINGINQEGWTALQLCVFHDKGYSVRGDLLEAGANPNIGGPASHLPLHIALIQKRSYSVLSDLLSKGANPNLLNSLGQSPLHLAVHPDMSYSILEELIAKGANVNFQDAKGMTPLHQLLKLGVDKDYSTCMDALVEAPGFNPNIRDPRGRIALHYHAKLGAFRDDDDDEGDPLMRLAAVLPRQQADAMLHMRVQARQNQRQWQQQMRQQRKRMRAHGRQMQKLMWQQRRHMQRVWDEEEEDEEEDEDDQDANEGDGTLVSALLRSGSDINAVDENGCTPLFYAAAAGHLEILVALLQAGAKPNIAAGIQNGCYSPLDTAIVGGHIAIVEALLQAGSTVRAPEPQYRNSCLHLAARDGKDSILALLLRAGADPNALNLQFLTPLHFAVEAGSLSSVETLISAGANVNALDSQGCTPLHCCTARFGDISIIWDLLLQSGADVHKQDAFGMTALMRAATGNLELNSLFLFLGSDPTQLNLTN